MNSTTGTDCSIAGNADISGLGIRLSLYILSLGGPLLSELCQSQELSTSIDSSLGITGLALFLSSVINSARKTMSLFHALCVFHLLCIVEISVSPKGHYPRSSSRVIAFTWLYYLATCGFLASTIYLFATAPTYGSQPECNSTIIYVIFGVNIPATAPIFRWIVVASVSCLLFPLIVSCPCMVVAWRFLNSQNDPTEGRDGRRSPKDSMLRLVGRLGGCSYIIAMLELIIKRNASRVTPEPELWTFGQVMAMMMLVGPLIDLLSFVLGNVDGDPTNSI